MNRPIAKYKSNLTSFLRILKIIPLSFRRYNFGSKTDIICRIHNVKAFTDNVIRRLQWLPEKARHTLTLDNGTENAQHEAITDAIGMQCYFARLYASWQRGTNESVNGLVRRYFLKGTDFSKIMDEQVAKVESIINNRPRKCLGYKTPLEVASAFVALRP